MPAGERSGDAPWECQREADRLHVHRQRLASEELCNLPQGCVRGRQRQQ